jgi:tetratricopeptide (TPR) repeat protein
MNHILKILSFILLTAPLISSAQNSYCPEKMLLIDKYKQKDYNGAKNYLDTVINKCPDQQNDPYYWHMAGAIYFNVFKFVDNRSPVARSRDQAVNAFLKSKKLDTKEKYNNNNLSGLKLLATTYYNDALLILQKMDTLHHEDVVKFYNQYKSITKKIAPNTDFSKKDIDINYGLGMLYKMKYENNKRNYRQFMDLSINCFNKSIAIDPEHYSSNYNLGIIYHNLGVDIILDDLDIDADLEKVIIMQEKAISYFSQALPYLKKVYEIKPTDKAIIQGIAAVYYSLNDMEKHVEYMNVLRDLDNPNSPNNK